MFEVLKEKLGLVLKKKVDDAYAMKDLILELTGLVGW